MSRLNQLVSKIKREHVFIQMHNYPDQDALASAFGLQKLLEVRGIKSTICYEGQIDKFNTLKMIEFLQIKIFNIVEISMNSKDEIILVDGQKGNVNMQNFVGEEIACIDHHPMQDVAGYRYYDIRSNMGSCSSIITEYFIENNIELPVNVATALLYGFKIDTANLSRKVSNHEIDIFCCLYKIANQSILRLFENNSLRKSDLFAYKDAISNLKLHGRIGIAQIGDECSEAIIGSISDFLLTLEEVDFTLVYSYRVGGLKFSIRSESKNVDAGLVIKEALKGIGDGGGHAFMAAGFIPDIVTEEEKRKLAQVVEQRVINMVNGC